MPAQPEFTALCSKTHVVNRWGEEPAGSLLALFLKQLSSHTLQCLLVNSPSLPWVCIRP